MDVDVLLTFAIEIADALDAAAPAVEVGRELGFARIGRDREQVAPRPAQRQVLVLAAAFEVDQVVITSPDPDRPARGELSAAHRYRVADGTLIPVEE